uniref:NHL repeat protein n=1 Tax=Leptospira ellisii TaxID=2023197 RepID=A0A2N0BE21_9LEPT|nr:hypothetical protein [Leptospira ellisii]PJZ94812.1 hypothetical protein CH379_00530 [Leptospira ellisii]
MEFQTVACVLGSPSGLLGKDCVGSFALGQKDVFSISEMLTGLGGNNGGLKLTVSPISNLRERVILTDTDSLRILIWNSIPSDFSQSPDLVLGTADRFSNSQLATFFLPADRKLLRIPESACSCNGQIFISDSGFNRVLVFNEPTFGPYPDASFVIGQPDFVTVSANTGGISAKSLNGPSGIDCFQNKLYVGDSTNARILVYDLPIVSDFPAASVVLGQPDFTSVSVFTAADNTLSTSIQDLFVSAEGLFATDTGFSRVLGWSLNSISDFAGAAVVFGQPNFTADIGTSGQGNLQSPASVGVYSGKLFISDTFNNRVIGSNSIPDLSSGGPYSGNNFDFALGQPDFVSSSSDGGSGTTNASGMQFPIGIVYSGGELSVFDGANYRILKFNSSNLVSAFSGASLVLPNSIFGQSTASGDLPFGGNLSPFSLYPSSVASDENRLYVLEPSKHRILVWNRMPIGGMEPPDFVLGQPDFFSTAANGGGPVGPFGLAFPQRILFRNGYFFVVDNGNNRILVWDHAPVSSSDAPSFVLGQPDFITGIAGGLSPSSLNLPMDVDFSDGKLLVADSGFNRVLIWNSMPAVNGAAADRVLGQDDMVTGNSGTVAANRFSNPGAIRYREGKIVLSVSNENRILIWNTFPNANGAPADVVLGQPNFTGSSRFNGAGNGSVLISARSLGNPDHLEILNGSLYVSDSGSLRILIWNSIPTATFADADRVFGQSNFTEGYPNRSGTNATGLNFPKGFTFAGGRFWIADSENRRVLNVKNL